MAVKNLVSGVLAQSIATSTTDVLVNIAENIDTSGIQSFFPTPPFYITIMPKTPAVGVANRLDSEILQVTAVGSDQSGNASLTCVRGQRDTTAKSFSAGDIVTVGVYAEDAVLLGGEGSTTSTTAYEKKLVDKDGNTIVPITGYMGKVYTATLSSATAGGRADYEFTPDTPLENNKVYAVKFPDPTVNNATIILGDGVVSGSILVPPVSATDSPNYELLTTDMINNTEPLLLIYNGVQWVCLNQKKKVATADLENKAVTSAKVDWATFKPYWKTVAISTSSNVTIPAGYRLYRIRLVGNKTGADNWGIIGCSQATGTTWIYIQGMSNGNWVAAERSVTAPSDKAVMDGSRGGARAGYQVWDIAISKPDKNGTEFLATWETGMAGSLTFNTGRSIFNVTNGTADINLFCELSSALWSVEALVEN